MTIWQFLEAVGWIHLGMKAEEEDWRMMDARHINPEYFMWHDFRRLCATLAVAGKAWEDGYDAGEEYMRNLWYDAL